MEAIKKIAAVKNHMLSVQLPETFDYPQVEVIVLPCDYAPIVSEDSAANWQQDFLSISCWNDPTEEVSLTSWPLKTV